MTISQMPPKEKASCTMNGKTGETEVHEVGALLLPEKVPERQAMLMERRQWTQPKAAP
jgi:hypothetical protein